jgi:hypothetical protein
MRHHVHAALQRPQLAVDRLAAVHRQCGHAAVLAVGVERLGHLDCELARRGQHQRLRLVPVDLHPVHDRQREGGGLAGAGLRLGDHIRSREHAPDRLGLHGRRLLVAKLGHSAQGRLAQPEIGKCGAGCLLLIRFHSPLSKTKRVGHRPSPAKR